MGKMHVGPQGNFLLQCHEWPLVEFEAKPTGGTQSSSYNTSMLGSSVAFRRAHEMGHCMSPRCDAIGLGMHPPQNAAPKFRNGSSQS